MTGDAAQDRIPQLALSVQQPWAWLVVHGHKDIENRDWPTRVRGPVAIHAGKKIDHDGVRFIAREYPDIALPTHFETGGIVGVVTVTDCVRSHPSRWFQGAYGFVLAGQRAVPFVPCRGQLGFFRWAPSSPSARVDDLFTPDDSPV